MAIFLRAAALSALLPASMASAEPQTVSWDIVAGLTTEIGPRLAGSPAEARARDWAAARLRKLGFSNVAIEPFTVRSYVRGEDRARLTAPYEQPLAITALGYSGTTPDKGIEAELVYFPTMDALRAAPAGSLAGKIAFIDHAMKANQDGSGYGPFGAARRQGPALAAQKGAIGTVIRSVGTDSHRVPHTGVTTFPEGVTAIPAGAVSNPDADLIARVAKQGKPMRLSLMLTGRTTENLPSGNVVADLVGRDPSLPPILVACHLDSWDIGTGAIDDGAGCAIVTDAALRAQRDGKALRTIRVLWAGSEEIGVFGGAAYAEKHGSEPHALAMESDFGAGRIWKVEMKLGAQNKPMAERISATLAAMGIVTGRDMAGGGADVGAIIAKQKLAVIDLAQDGTDYFNLHHTADDTLDKVDPALLEQNVEAWTQVLSIVANEPGPIAAE
ncbi:M28 family peptidase [Sphingobium lignivorans]|uniref:Carboxypeptidase Q n=1 Tax=Sphingobium lignivorans TaxID=2735886 RepID=A0ABR6NIH0_9SPHN|nr:M28 family peptidase [Sphingobium lignivorans]MBB5987074.1 Zn-dependent M28 family amino/carboxypeptidase [Sphingobium lignivorans]